MRGSGRQVVVRVLEPRGATRPRAHPLQPASPLPVFCFLILYLTWNLWEKLDRSQQPPHGPGNGHAPACGGRTTDSGVQGPALPWSLHPPARSPPHPPARHRAGEAPSPRSVLPDGVTASPERQLLIFDAATNSARTRSWGAGPPSPRRGDEVGGLSSGGGGAASTGTPGLAELRGTAAWGRRAWCSAQREGLPEAPPSLPERPGATIP